MEPIVILIILCLFFCLLFLWAGMPLGMQASMEGFVDTFEQIDFKSYGRRTVDYCALRGTPVRLRGRGHLHFRLPEWPRPTWIRQHITCEIIKSETPAELVLQLEPVAGPERYATGYPMKIPYASVKEGRFDFKLVLQPINADIQWSEPVEIKCAIRLRYRAPSWLPNSSLETMVTYHFLLGPDLGNVWLGIDPGTSGCCIAAASPVQPAVIEQVHGEDKITPSMITFDLEQSPEEFFQKEGRLCTQLYEFGEAARAKMLIPNMHTLQSIKKMIGFKDEYRIQFANDRVLLLNARLLQTALLGSLYTDFANYLAANKDSFAGLLNEGKAFQPQRAVITIPNNYTPHQISELIRCVQASAELKEVRYLTESEAIACYYLSRPKGQDQRAQTENRRENLLIFDMGGASINTTVLQVQYHHGHSEDQPGSAYRLKTGSKIGYGIGGDTIDYCILKTFLHYSQEKDFPIEKSIWDFYPENTIRNFYQQTSHWQHICLEIKKKIRRRFDSNDLIALGAATSAYQASTLSLLSLAEVSDYCERITGKACTFDANSSLVRQFVKDDNGRFSLLHNAFFRRWVFTPVRDAVREALRLSAELIPGIDTIIMAGRSSAFPLIDQLLLEVVREQILAAQISLPAVLRLDDKHLKSAVARGASWYGVHNKAVQLAPALVSNTFGVKQTLSADTGTLSSTR
ncbi:MAG: Hsp70 family protein [Bacteroidota bacterium]